MDPRQFVAFVQSRRFTLSDEKVLQSEIAAELEKSGAPFEREVRLAPGDIVDFMLHGGTAVEVKIKGSKRAIYGQCARYCAHADVKALVLVTAVAMGFPPEIDGKPCYVASLGRAWL